MSGRVLHRPLGGWSAKIWRRQVLGWLQAALGVLAIYGFCKSIEGLLAFTFG